MKRTELINYMASAINHHTFQKMIDKLKEDEESNFLLDKLRVGGYTIEVEFDGDETEIIFTKGRKEHDLPLLSAEITKKLYRFDSDEVQDEYKLLKAEYKSLEDTEHYLYSYR